MKMIESLKDVEEEEEEEEDEQFMECEELEVEEECLWKKKVKVEEVLQVEKV